MSQKSQNNFGGEGGNTKAPSIRARNWCFTLNNYTEKEFEYTKKYCEIHCKNYRIGKEVGKKGTPHLQGFFVFKNQKKFDTLKKQLNVISTKFHLEKMKGSIKENIKYCEKDGIISKPKTWQETLNLLILNTEYNNVKWKPFQKEILNIIKTEPDSRTIHWYWDSKGNIGKSYLVKYINIIRNDVIVGEGKTNDIFNQVKVLMDEKIIPKIIIVDVPRSSLDYINYSAFEKLKNGLIFSGKYEGGKCIFPCPHVLVFANEPPNILKLSNDRWKITMLK